MVNFRTSDGTVYQTQVKPLWSAAKIRFTEILVTMIQPRFRHWNDLWRFIPMSAMIYWSNMVKLEGELMCYKRLG